MYLPGSGSKPDVSQLISALTRTESGKLIAVLTRIFGAHNLTMAEDAVQDVWIKALEHWQANGVPDNPVAWLYKAAKNRAIDIIRKNRRRQVFAPDITQLVDSEYAAAITLEECFREEEIRDDQLRMMFACCHPVISREGQVALILRTLCGFSIPQVARAYITSADTIEKRLYRAKQAFRERQVALEIPSGTDLQKRLDGVLETLYLLFNEAHSASYHDSLIRKDLADDCIRLCSMVAEHEITRFPRTDALLALFCFHTARLQGRVDDNGNLLLLKDQDRALWDKELITKGIYHLSRSATGTHVSKYHLEAAIAYEHCKVRSYRETDWKAILGFYDMLVTITPSPVIFLNRAIVIKELMGPHEALAVIRAITGINFLDKYYLLHAIIGELHLEMHHPHLAKPRFETALKLAVSDAEKRFVRQKLDNITAMQN